MVDFCSIRWLCTTLQPRWAIFMDFSVTKYLSHAHSAVDRTYQLMWRILNGEMPKSGVTAPKLAVVLIGEPC